MPSIPPVAIVQIPENLLPVPALETPQASPIPNPLPKETPTPVSVAILKKKPAKPNQVPSIKKVTSTSDSSKRQEVAVIKNSDFPKEL